MPSRSFPSSQTQALHAIVHLGAGRCRELPAYLASGAERIVLVEAEPRQLGKLKERVGDERRVEVIGAAVAGEKGPASLNVYNEPELTSLREPSGILKLYPGLRLERRIPVEIVAITDLLSALKLDNAEAALVIDAPGEEFSILEALSAANVLDGFHSVRVHSGAYALFAGGRDAAAVTDILAKPGWALGRKPLPGDPDRIVVSADFSRSLQELVRVKTALAESKEQAREARERASAAEARASEAETQASAAKERARGADARANAAEARAKEAAENDAATKLEVGRLNAEATAAKEKMRKMKDEAESLGAEISELRKKIESLTLLDVEREFRRAGMAREVARLEAQLELIQELVLRDARL